MDDQSVAGALPMRLPTVAFDCLEKRPLWNDPDPVSVLFAATRWKGEEENWFSFAIFCCNTIHYDVIEELPNGLD